MTMVGVAAFIGNHANQLIAFHLGFEAATNATIGAGRDLGVLGHAMLDHRVFHQGGSGAGLYAGATTHALGIHKINASGTDFGFEPATVDRQGKGTLNL